MSYILKHALLKLFRLKMNQRASAAGIELEVHIPPDGTGVQNPTQIAFKI